MWNLTCLPRRTTFIAEEQTYINSYRQTRIIFSATCLPFPCFIVRRSPRLVRICHFDFDPTANPLWNIESINKGDPVKMIGNYLTIFAIRI